MRVLGAILAGGASSRFGSDKAVALFEGRELIEHALDAMRPFADRMIVCGRNLAGRDSIADRPGPGLGPLGGLCAALAFGAENDFDVVLTAPCDTPVIPGDVFEALLAGKAGAFVANLPVLGAWPTALAPTLDRLLAAPGDRSVRNWARANGVAALDLPPIANINYPTDLIALGSSHG
jgi:molybdopterin-guanine dinucleotide biosynthesis protein A